MKVNEENVTNFMEVTESTEYTALYFLKKAMSMDDAVTSFFDRGCPVIDEPEDYKSIFAKKTELKAPDLTKSGNPIRKAFAKLSPTSNGMINSSNIEEFAAELGIPCDGVQFYVLGYLGKCKFFQHFEEKEIQEIEKYINCDETASQCCERFIRSLSTNEYYNFFSVIYRWLIITINEFNKTVASDEKTTMLDQLETVYNDILSEEMKSSDVFKLVIDYMCHYHPESKKKGLVMMDTFAYMPVFLTTYKSPSQLKMTQEQIDDLCTLPSFYTDFLEYMNSKKRVCE